MKKIEENNNLKLRVYDFIDKSIFLVGLLILSRSIMNVTFNLADNDLLMISQKCS